MSDKITTLFLDIGGVLLTNGWDRQARNKAVERFKLDGEEVNERHHLTFDTYESGKINLDEYLTRVVFYEERKFTREEFRKFMFEQSKPLPGSLDFFIELKQKYGLKVIAVSNEAREINEHRIKQYKLGDLFNGFISSCYVHLRKPDTDIFKVALDVSQTPLSNILYIDDRLMFIEVATKLGIKSFQFKTLDETKAYMETLSFSNEHSVKI